MCARNIPVIADKDLTRGPLVSGVEGDSSTEILGKDFPCVRSGK